MFGQLLFVHSPGHAHRLGMVGDGDIGIAHLFRLAGHLQDGVFSVGGGGVHLQVPADVRKLDQPGEGSFFRGLDFPPVFPEFRRDRGKPHGLEDVLFLAAA